MSGGAGTQQETEQRSKGTPSLVSEVPLRVTKAQEQVLLARLEAAWQVYNACLDQARVRVRLVSGVQSLSACPNLA